MNFLIVTPINPNPVIDNSSIIGLAVGVVLSIIILYIVTREPKVRVKAK